MKTYEDCHFDARTCKGLEQETMSRQTSTSSHLWEGEWGERVSGFTSLDPEDVQVHRQTLQKTF